MAGVGGAVPTDTAVQVRVCMYTTSTTHIHKLHMMYKNQ